MGATYDTPEIRRIVNRIGPVSQQVENVSQNTLGRILAEVTITLKGETADAFAGHVAKSAFEIKRVASQLSEVQDILLKFADLLNEADEQARSEIQAR